MKRWRVARVIDGATGYESPAIWFWTRRGAQNAAWRWNDLYERVNKRAGVTDVFRSDDGFPSWTAITHREFMALRIDAARRVSLVRHPAGRTRLTEPITSLPVSSPVDVSALKEYWLKVDINALKSLPPQGDPVQPDGDVVQRGPITWLDETEPRGEDDEVAESAASTPDTLPDTTLDAGTNDSWRGTKSRPDDVPDETSRDARGK